MKKSLLEKKVTGYFVNSLVAMGRQWLLVFHSNLFFT
jgi:hypothetical protein